MNFNAHELSAIRAGIEYLAMLEFGPHVTQARMLRERFQQGIAPTAKLKCYYAHPMTLYGTKQEARDIELLEALGFEVVNPNTPEHERGMWEFGGRPGDPRSMDYFRMVATHCDVVAFRALPDGSITLGVAEEIKVAKRVFELPSGVLRRTLTKEQTYETLRESGQR